MYVTIDPALPTPVTFCEIFPPDHFPLYFYRYPQAPDLRVTPEEIAPVAVRESRLFWATLTGLSAEPSRTAHAAAWELRERRPHTVIDLDYRPQFWRDPSEATWAAGAAIAASTVAIGNLEECRVAVGTDTRRTPPRRCWTGAWSSPWSSRVPRGSSPCPLGRAARGAAGAHRGRERPRRRRRLRWCVLPRAARGVALERTLRFANSAGAIVASRLECSTAMPDEREVLALMDGTHGMTTIDTAASPHAASLSRMPCRAAWAARLRRSTLSVDGRLLLIAADHPARGALAVRDDIRAMAPPALLERLAPHSSAGGRRACSAPPTCSRTCCSGVLDDKVVIGSMNRGGLQGAVFELDDRFTAYDADTIAANGLDGGKMLTRIALEDPGTAPTLEASGDAVKRSPSTGRWPWSSRS